MKIGISQMEISAIEIVILVIAIAIVDTFVFWLGFQAGKEFPPEVLK